MFGILQRNLLTGKLSSAFGSGTFGNTRELLTPEKRAAIPKETTDKIVDFLSSLISTMFLWALIPAGFSFVTILFMGNARMIIPVQDQAAGQDKAKAEWSSGH